MEMLLWAIFQSPSSWRNTSTSRAVSRANSASGMGSRMWKNAVTATTSSLSSWGKRSTTSMPLRPGALMNVALHALSVHVHVHVHVHVLCAASKTPLAELLHLVSRTAPSPRLQARVKTPNSECVAGNANKEAVRVRALGDARCRRYFQRRCARLG